MGEQYGTVEPNGTGTAPATLGPAAREGAAGAGSWKAAVYPATLASRKDLQLARRLNHMVAGVAIATAYAMFLDYQHITHIFGVVVCAIYIADRIRMHYPEAMQNLPTLNRLFFRAEEQLKESAMVPFVVAILLTLLTFPKAAALIAIYAVAIGDPVSAIVGIKFGRHPLLSGKTVEGSIAFLVTVLAKAVLILHFAAGATWGDSVVAGLLIAVPATVFDQIPLRLDDNLTIPLFVGFLGWAVSAWYLGIF